MLAIKTYRDRWQSLYPDEEYPELIKCVTGHPAIAKGC